MESHLSSVSDTLLMGPGPSNIPDPVMQALALPTVGHLDPRFIGIMDEVRSMLRQVFGTGNQMTLPVSGTGSAGMATCFVNIVEPGDAVLILQNGVFGERMAEVPGRLGADADVVKFDWGTPVTTDRVRTALEEREYRLVAVVHAETSTGVLNPVAEIGALVKETGALFVVDAVTSLGGIDVQVDHQIEIGGGLGPLAGKIWRVGLMGHSARRENVDRFVAALQSVLVA